MELTPPEDKPRVIVYGKNGGWRPGAGRKKGSKTKKTILEAEARNLLIKNYLDDWDLILQTLKEQALGDYYYEKVEGDVIKIYKASPNVSALENIIETVVGKPKQPVEGTLDLPAVQKLADSVRAILEKKTNG